MKESTLLSFIDILHVTLKQSHKMILTNMLVIILLQVVCEQDSNITELYPENIKQNIESSKIKLPMPVLALGGECSFGTAALDSMRLLATDVRGGIVPDSGHWIPEEQPQFLVDQLFKFFNNRTN